jgi:hypothetical protein
MYYPHLKVILWRSFQVWNSWARSDYSGIHRVRAGSGSEMLCCVGCVVMVRCVCVRACAGHYESKMNVGTVTTFCVLAEKKSTTLQAERIFPVQWLVLCLCVWLVFKTCCMPLGYFIYISFMVFFVYGTRLSAWFCSRSLKSLCDFVSFFISFLCFRILFHFVYNSPSHLSFATLFFFFPRTAFMFQFSYVLLLWQSFLVLQLCLAFISLLRSLLFKISFTFLVHTLPSWSSSSSSSSRIRRVSCLVILRMNLVPPSLPRSSYVSSSFWFILQCLFRYPVCVHPLYVL